MFEERLEYLAREIKTDWAHRCRPPGVRRRPPIVTLCGSTRFKDEFLLANRVFTLAGVMVLTVGTFPHAEGDGDKEVSMGEAVAADLDALHVQKVVHGDYVVMLNVGHYLGNSAYLEYKAAKREGKKILWLEELPLSVREIVNEWASHYKTTQIIGALKADAEAVTRRDDSFSETTDAMRWADEFVSRFKGHTVAAGDIDEGLMVGWFANAFAAQESADRRDAPLKQDGAADYEERGMKDPGLPAYTPHVIGFDDQGRPSVVLNLYLP
jgi:hypothetical protein